MNMITCRELSRLLTDYFDGEMGPWQRLNIRVHLLLCKDCRIHLVKMRQLIEALARIPDDTSHPPDFVAQLLRGKESAGHE